MKNVLLSALLLSCLIPLGAEGAKLTKLEFRDRPIADIILALGEAGQISIVPDVTVTGNASYYFADVPVETALAKFAASFNLYVTVKDGIRYVSRIDARFDAATGLASLNAEEVRLPLVIRAFSKAIGKSILFDDVPDRTVTIHAEGLKPQVVAAIIARSAPNLSLEVADDFYQLRRVDPPKAGATGASHAQGFTRNGELFSLDARRTAYLDLLGDLFNAAGKDYSILSRGDSVIDGLTFKNRNFEEALGLILEQASADCTVLGGTYYIFEIQRKDVIKKLKASLSLPVENFAVADVIALLPPDFSSSGTVKYDKSSNMIYLSGSLEEIKPIEDFIRQLDRPPNGKSYQRFDLRNLKAKDAIALFPSRFSSLAPLVLPDGSGLVALVSEATAADLRAFLELIDRRAAAAPIRLRYVKAEDILKNLPPSATKENLTDGGNGSLLFFTGPEERRKAFLEDLALLDRPKPQIRYDVLVVQYTVQDNMDVSGSATIGPVGSSVPAGSLDPVGIVANLGGLLSLRFDAIAELGLKFAATLNWNLQNDRAQIFADTTLHGVVGRDLKFQNTTTYRYKDTVVDNAGNTTSAVTREVSSGLILTLNGWVSGDGMITVDVNATASERTDASGSSGSAPTTSERVVSTQVRTPSGVPISIGGLRQRKAELVVHKIPLLGSIPLLGKLFQTSIDKVSDTEIVIYLVPYQVPDAGAGAASDFELEGVYRELVKGY